MIIVFLFNSFTVISQTTYNISNPQDLENQTYIAGDVIILADGTYNTDARIDFVGNGTSANPITFRAQTPGGVKFTGGLQMNIGGDYVVVDGFHWQGGYGASNFIQFRNGSDYANHSTIQNCAIDGLGIHPDDIEVDSIVKHRWIVLYGTYNTVINCSFMNKVSAGALILAEYQYNAENDRCATVGHTISNNYFYKYAKIDNTLSNSGDSETIRIGTSEYQNVNSNVTVSNNYFVEADGENEIITNKSKNNTYTNNTFRRCRGSLVLRHGSNATVDGNYFLGEDVDGTGGIRITDSDHTITNNYIQDCITVVDQAKWNNGITFIGGGANAAVACTSTSTSNGYQKSENINLSNNTIINTNAPLFYNTDKGSNDVTGTVSNNLIYFAAADPNLSDIITGDTASSYADIGTTLTYTGNVYKGTTLGETNTGFSEENGITATPDGEIFTFSGTGSNDKGANMGAYTPIIDTMVGDGIGACFLDNEGGPSLTTNCTITAPESLTVSSLSTLSPDAGSYDVSVNANVSWTAVSNDAWISIDTNSANGDATVSVTVTENTDTNSRMGTVTFTQDPGGDNIIRTLTVSQEEADPRTGLNLINPTFTDVEVAYFCYEETVANGHSGKFNDAFKSLDKDTGTQWAASASLGDCASDDRASIIYDLKGSFDLELIDIATTNNKTYLLQIWVSSTGTADGDFTNAFPPPYDTANPEWRLSNADATFKAFVLPATAMDTKYVKLIGNGQTGGSRWTTIHEIEFYGTQSSLSVDNKGLQNNIVLYPVPAKNKLHIKNLNSSVNALNIFSLDGRKVLEKTINSTDLELDTSLISNGTYIINFTGNNLSVSKMLIVSH